MSLLADQKFQQPIHGYYFFVSLVFEEPIDVEAYKVYENFHELNIFQVRIRLGDEDR